MSNLTNTIKNSIRVLDGNIPDTEGYYIVSYEGTVVAAYDATRSLDDFITTHVDTSEWDFDARNALTLSCKVAF